MNKLYTHLFFCLMLPISVHAHIQSNEHHWQILYQRLIVQPELKAQTMGTTFARLTRSCLMAGSVGLVISAIKKMFTEKNLNADQKLIAQITSMISGVFYFAHSYTNEALEAQKKALTKFISRWPLHKESTPKEFHASFNELYHAYLLHEQIVFDQLLEEHFAIITNILKQKNFESKNHAIQAIYVHHYDIAHTMSVLADICYKIWKINSTCQHKKNNIHACL